MKAVEYAKVNNNRKAAEHFQIDESMVRRWRRDEVMLNQVPNQSRKSKMRNRRAKWPNLESDLKKWVVDQRARGSQVSGKSILSQARAIAKEKNVEFVGSLKWVFNFMKRNDLVRRSVASAGEQLPGDWEEKMKSFAEFVRGHLPNVDLSDVGCMDEVPVSFDVPTTFATGEEGTSDVGIGTAGHEKENFTVALAATADGKKLPPYVVFKCKTLPECKVPKNVVVSANEKGCMSSEEVTTWLREVWEKRPRSSADGSAVLLLDAAIEHRAESVESCCRSMRTVPCVIPDGLSSKLQPLEISVNRSFKSNLRECWEKWMVKGFKSFTKNGSMKRASHEEILKWIDSAWRNVPEIAVINGFKKTGIKLYDTQCNEENFIEEIIIDSDSSDDDDIFEDEEIQNHLYDILANGFDMDLDDEVYD
ncbi:UNVERIFIED_CONTAM: hypothetical protein PYX00_000251 [Menopon gallinae]|uniref:HTH CENPB-type domain-containing protein n=1 Tax=Menopon gallinae TaxID=328185 RepID=A0AAW2I9K2_9NEOP